jgi:ficolin
MLYLIYASAIFGLGTAGDKLRNHNGRKFSTNDQDNDNSEANCAFNVKGAWWFYDCRTSDLNGVYWNRVDKNSDSVLWRDIRAAKRAEMKIRPILNF